MTTRVRPLELPFDVALTLPGSKSVAQRALVAACLRRRETRLVGVPESGDVDVMTAGLAALGFGVERQGPDVLVRGGLPRQPRDVEIDCHNNGTAMRFLTAVAALRPGRTTLRGAARPLGPLAVALRSLGARVEDSNGVPPVVVHGGEIEIGPVTIDASRSSQFASALTLIGCEVSLSGPLASPGYLDLTGSVMDELRRRDVFEVEGDWSAFGAFLVLAEMTGSRAVATNLRADSLQPDRAIGDAIANLRDAGDMSLDCSAIPDQVMNLAVLAARRAAVTELVGVPHLRDKESDRISVLAQELSKAGIPIEALEDGVRIDGKTNLRPARLDPKGDHRMAMAFAILGAVFEGIDIGNPDCVDKSFPDFFSAWSSLAASPRCIALCGMRASGKTVVGEQLAADLGLDFVDTDVLFERQHEPIAAFVDRHGWAEFRRIEERIVAEALAPGTVVALGGGAIESDATRERLRRDAAVAWLDVPLEGLRVRLANGLDRPSLTGADVLEELPEILERRRPWFEGVADVRVEAQGSIAEVASEVRRALRARCRW